MRPRNPVLGDVSDLLRQHRAAYGLVTSHLQIRRRAILFAPVGQGAPIS